MQIYNGRMKEELQTDCSTCAWVMSTQEGRLKLFDKLTKFSRLCQTYKIGGEACDGRSSNRPRTGVYHWHCSWEVLTNLYSLCLASFEQNYTMCLVNYINNFCTVIIIITVSSSAPTLSKTGKIRTLELASAEVRNWPFPNWTLILTN